MEKNEILKEFKEIKNTDAKNILLDIIKREPNETVEVLFSKYFQSRVVFVGLKKSTPKKDLEIKPAPAPEPQPEPEVIAPRPEHTPQPEQEEQEPRIKEVPEHIEERPTMTKPVISEAKEKPKKESETVELNDDDIYTMLDDMENANEPNQ